MSPPRRRYGREFKFEVVSRVRGTGRSQAQVAEKYGISPNTLSRFDRPASCDPPTGDSRA